MNRMLLNATRVWLPVAIAVAGVVGIVIGRGHTAAAAAGVGLIIAALIVWLLNWMYRMSIESNRDREREEEARTAAENAVKTYQEWAAARLSASGNCYFITDYSAGAGAGTFRAHIAPPGAPCTGNQALTVVANDNSW